MNIDYYFKSKYLLQISQINYSLLNDQDTVTRVHDPCQLTQVRLVLCSSLFEPDNVRTGVSWKKILDMGGIHGLEDVLSTNSKAGLVQNAADTKARVQAYGINKPIIKKSKSFCEMVVDNFKDTTLQILTAAAFVSLALGIYTQGWRLGWLEGISIIIAVLIIVSVTTINNYFKEQQFLKLNAMSKQKNVNVYKNGVLTHMSVYELMVGDLVEVETGEIMSVDGLIVRGTEVMADESAITGESIEIRKKPFTEKQSNNPFLISGSKVVDGNCTIFVLAVGANSQDGKLKAKIQQQTEETPLQHKLEKLATQIGLAGMSCAIITFIIMCANYLWTCYRSGHFKESLLSMQTIQQLISNFIVGVSIIVMSVPEGLPLSVTIALAYSVGKMKEENNLVRYLHACETMGGADNVCSDKTGTLTMNKMTVTKLFIQGQQINTNAIPSPLTTPEITNILIHGICQNSTANPIMEMGKSQQIGNKTECATLQLAYRLGFDYKKVRNKDRILVSYPFSSARKKMTTIYRAEDGIYVFCKGAPEYIIPLCTKYVNMDGHIVEADEKWRQSMDKVITLNASECLRNLYFAFKKVPEGANIPSEFRESKGTEIETLALNRIRSKKSGIEIIEEPEHFEEIIAQIDTTFSDSPQDLIGLAMVGIKDPIREEIPDAVRRCHEAGVTVRMVTGDNKETAFAIAKQAGILNKDADLQAYPYMCMEGKDFRTFVQGLENEGTKDQRVKNLENFKLVESQLRVLARSSPEDKYILATGLKQLGHVVAMTGDGTNDAPALKKADIGFAMGITGTQVAKDAAGIILLDDNFKSIVTAIKWGRNIYDCIRKFLQFQLTVNCVALTTAMIGAVFLNTTPLNAIQMLWVNLIMDSMASLAEATEPPEQSLLKRKPYKRDESLVTGTMIKNIISVAIYQICVLVFIMFKGNLIFDIPVMMGTVNMANVVGYHPELLKHGTIFFNTFVFMQQFNEINARKINHWEMNVFQHFCNNQLFIIIQVITTVTQVLIVQYGGIYVKVCPLSVKEHLICVFIGLTVLVAMFISKLILPHRIECNSEAVEIGRCRYKWRYEEVDEVSRD